MAGEFAEDWGAPAAGVAAVSSEVSAIKLDESLNAASATTGGSSALADVQQKKPSAETITRPCKIFRKTLIGAP